MSRAREEHLGYRVAVNISRPPGSTPVIAVHGRIISIDRDRNHPQGGLFTLVYLPSYPGANVTTQRFYINRTTVARLP